MTLENSEYTRRPASERVFGGAEEDENSAKFQAASEQHEKSRSEQWDHRSHPQAPGDKNGNMHNRNNRSS